MFRHWAHVIIGCAVGWVLHFWLLVAAHHIAGAVIELVRDEIAVTAYDSAKAIALGE